MPEPLPTILLEETLPVTPRELWLLVMGSSDLLKSVAKVKKNRDLKIGRWRLGKGTDRVHEPYSCHGLHNLNRHPPGVVHSRCSICDQLEIHLPATLHHLKLPLQVTRRSAK